MRHRWDGIDGMGGMRTDLRDGWDGLKVTGMVWDG